MCTFYQFYCCWQCCASKLFRKMASQGNARACASTTTKGLKRKSQELSSDESSCYDPSTEEDSESEPDCDEYDQNCKVIAATIGKHTLHGFHLMPTCLPERVDPSKNCAPKISDSLKSDAFTNDFIRKWSQEIAFEDHNVQIIAEPWKACVINGLLDDDSALHDVRQEFYELAWNRRRMDLYDFHQSRDLKHVNTDRVKSMYEFLKNDVMPWVGELMQVKLKNISATCSFYTDTDYLLVHDDQQDDRVVAFVLYLSDVCPWDETWGGALQLLDRDANGQPRKSQREIYPKHNQLILFPVSNVTYHRVDEVTTKNFCRLSINGWFHGEVIPSKEIVKYVPPTVGLYGNDHATAGPVTVDLNRWINKDYLRAGTMSQIQEHIEEHSEISLEDFFVEKRFRCVLDALRCTQTGWKVAGPPNRFHYEVLDVENTSADISEFIDVFKSKEMFRLLQKYTDLELSNDGAALKFELQRWTPGCYSLLSDYEWNSSQELDIVVFLGCRGVVGGQVQYVSQDEEIHQALITLEPKDNTLNVVYRDTARITCYVSKHTKTEFYVLLCSYMEPKIK